MVLKSGAYSPASASFSGYQERGKEGTYDLLINGQVQRTPPRSCLALAGPQGQRARHNPRRKAQNGRQSLPTRRKRERGKVLSYGLPMTLRRCIKGLSLQKPLKAR